MQLWSFRAGFAIAYAYSIVGIFQFTSRLQADVSARFFSVQRIVDYTTLVPVEDSAEVATGAGADCVLFPLRLHVRCFVVPQ